MKLSALKKRAKEAGVDEEKIEDADDADDVKSTVIQLIVAAERGATLEKLRAELSAMKVTALKKRAKEVGVDEEKLEDADDEDDVKGTVIGLILEQAQAA